MVDDLRWSVVSLRQQQIEKPKNSGLEFHDGNDIQDLNFFAEQARVSPNPFPYTSQQIKSHCIDTVCRGHTPSRVKQRVYD